MKKERYNALRQELIDEMIGKLDKQQEFINAQESVYGLGSIEYEKAHAEKLGLTRALYCIKRILLEQ